MTRRWSVTSASTALLLALVVQDLAGQAAPPASRPESEAELYIGSDSLQRRFFLPAFRFLFPLCGFRLTTSVAFEHVTNGSLEGRVDFWLGAGLGLRNQRHFERLERPFRFEVFAGREFDRGTEATSFSSSGTASASGRSWPWSSSA